MKSLSAYVDRRFAARMARHLAKVLPGPGAGESEGEAGDDLAMAEARFGPVMERGIQYADARGFVHEDEVALVVVLHAAANVDPACEELLRPWAAETLQRDESSTLARLVWIEHQVAELAVSDPAARRLQTALQTTRETFG